MSTAEAHPYRSLCLQSSPSASWSRKLSLDLNVISLRKSSPFSSGGDLHLLHAVTIHSTFLLHSAANCYDNITLRMLE